MGASLSMSTADQLFQQNTFMIYINIVFVIIIVILLNVYRSIELLFGVIAIVGFLYYLSSRKWRYVAV